MAKPKVNDIFIKIICLIASIAIWVLIINTTNPKQRMTLSEVPVQIQNADSLESKGLILVPNQALTTKVTVEGKSSEVFALRNDSINVILDINQRTLKVGENEVQTTFVQAPSGINLMGSNPKVKIKVDEFTKKPVEIKKDRLAYEAAENAYIPEPSIDKNFVTVSGAKQNVDRVAAVRPVMKSKKITESSREVLRLEPMDAEDQVVKGVTLSDSYVEVLVTPQPVKEVPVVAQQSGSNSAILLKEIKAQPASLKVTARSNLLKNIEELKTQPLNLSMVEPGVNTYSRDLLVPNDIVILDGEGKPMDPVVDVQTTAEAIARKTFAREVAITGVPASGQLKNVGETVSVVLSATQSKLDALVADQIKVTAPVQGLEPGAHRINVTVEVPEGFEVISYAPQSISITIE